MTEQLNCTEPNIKVEGSGGEKAQVKLPQEVGKTHHECRKSENRLRPGCSYWITSVDNGSSSPRSSELPFGGVFMCLHLYSTLSNSQHQYCFLEGLFWACGVLFLQAQRTKFDPKKWVWNSKVQCHGWRLLQCWGNTESSQISQAHLASFSFLFLFKLPCQLPLEDFYFFPGNSSQRNSFQQIES